MRKEFRFSALSVSLIMFLLGVVLTVKPALSVRFICYLVAGCILAFSLTRLVTFLQLRKSGAPGSTANLVFAVVSVALAIWIALHPDSLATVIPVFLGLVIAANGIVLILSALTYREFLPNRGIVTILFGAALLMLGIYSIRHSFSIQVMLMRFLGIALLISGGSNLINYLLLDKADTKRRDATTVNFEVHRNK